MLKNKGFIEMILPGAKRCYEDFKILPSVTLAQAILESNWGKSAPGHNLFGIKASASWTGQVQSLKTKEWNGQCMVKTTCNFRAYASYEKSILDHGILLTTPRYHKVREASDYKTACRELVCAGYATDPNYSKKLIAIIDHHRLYEYDKKELSAWDKEKAAARKWVMENGISDGGNPEGVASREMVWVMIRRMGI